MTGVRQRFLDLRLGPWSAAAVAAAFGVIFLLLQRQQEFIDFHVYHLGGRTVLDGGPLYEVVYRTGHGLPLLFTYTPFAAVLMTPLALVPFHVALVVWTIASVVAWGLSVWSTATALRHPAAYCLVLVGSIWWFLPLVRDLKLGQINSFLVLAILVDLATSRLGRGRGVLTGIAAGIKLTPLVFLPWLVLTRQFRTAVAMVVGFVGSVVVGAVVLPKPTWDYWTGLAWASNRVGDATYVSNQSIKGLLARFALSGHTLTLTWLATAGVIGLVCLVLAVRQERAGEHRLAVMTMALAALFCSPISWSHHWIWIGPIVVTALELRRWRDPIGYLVLALYVWAPIWHVPREQHRELHWTTWQHVQGEMYVVGGAVTLAWLVWITRGLDRSRSGRNPAPQGT